VYSNASFLYWQSLIFCALLCLLPLDSSEFVQPLHDPAGDRKGRHMIERHLAHRDHSPECSFQVREAGKHEIQNECHPHEILDQGLQASTWL
jgi:hypothetical protein